MKSRPCVLIVDDEVRSQEAIRRVLKEEFDTLTASSAADAEALLNNELIHVILCDQRMPGESGVDFLKRVRDCWPDPVRLIISGYSDSENIIAGVNEAGIYQYLTKPWEPDRLLEVVRGAAELFRLQQDNQNVSVEIKRAAPALQQTIAEKRRILQHHYAFKSIIHAPDSPLARLCSLAMRIAEYDIPVLITGESGTGKDLLARAIHYSSPRREGSFVAENCGALPDQLLESELFGCKKGAFTGAYEDRIGLFEQADDGSIFLDEIGETSLTFQVKLLRVLQEGEIRPLGNTRRRRVDVRVIAATNCDLEAAVAERRFRPDLYYRLGAFPLHLPPLRSRPMDIPLLAAHLLERTAASFHKHITGFSDTVLARFSSYAWPGNVREMQNEIQRMVALADGPVLGPDLLSPRLGSGRVATAMDITQPLSPTLTDGMSLKEQVESFEERIIRDTLRRHGWNISRAARALGLSRVGLRGKLQRYGLERVN